VVAAVWNGKEALDYLLAADTPNPPHPKPDIILMDVQMPIMDGYRATHLIRHHAPYSVSARDVPIVAMTASAIQGDREKCKKAGMDDYLAKPVKGKTLEKMLVRWAINKRAPRTPSEGEYDGSECSETAEETCGAARIPLFGPEIEATPLTAPRPILTQTTTSAPLPRPSMEEEQNSQHLTLPGTETEGDRAEMRSEAEEKAIALRDDKLVQAAGVRGEGLVPHAENARAQGQKLTVENVGKLEMEVKGRGPRSEFKLQGRKLSVSENASVEREKAESSGGERPKLERRWMDSDRTVRGLK
jgi:CheY-like chemotaxis protein